MVSFDFTASTNELMNLTADKNKTFLSGCLALDSHAIAFNKWVFPVPTGPCMYKGLNSTGIFFWGCETRIDAAWASAFDLPTT